MTHYIAFIEPGPKNYSAYFPDLPGCASAGDTLDETVTNAGEALAAHVGLMTEDGELVPSPRSIEEIKADPEHVRDMHEVIVVAIPLAELPHSAAAE
jgi:predicted RNase H-like HicB family nuclease